MKQLCITLLLACVCSSGQQQSSSSDNAGLCRAPVMCPPTDGRDAEVCSLPDGSRGAICAPPPSPSRPLPPLGGREPLIGSSRHLPAGSARHLPAGRRLLTAPPGSFSSAAAERRAALVWSDLQRLEQQLMADLHRAGAAAADLTGPEREPASEAAAQEIGRVGLRRLVTIQAVSNQTALYSDEDGRLPPLRVPDCIPARTVFCDPSAADRSLSGECNHPQNPFLGRALTGLGRLASATYDDQLFFSARSVAADGSALPSPSAAGSLVTRHRRQRPLNRWATLWSELLQRDLVQLGALRLPNGRQLDCCTESHPACLPLHVAGRCVSFVRALPAPELDCVMRPVAPLSAASTYLDLEPLYGGTEETSRQLRALHGGRLMVESDSDSNSDSGLTVELTDSDGRLAPDSSRDRRGLGLGLLGAPLGRPVSGRNLVPRGSSTDSKPQRVSLESKPSTKIEHVTKSTQTAEPRPPVTSSPVTTLAPSTQSTQQAVATVANQDVARSRPEKHLYKDNVKLEDNIELLDDSLEISDDNSELSDQNLEMLDDNSELSDQNLELLDENSESSDDKLELLDDKILPWVFDKLPGLEFWSNSPKGGLIFVKGPKGKKGHKGMKGMKGMPGRKGRPGMKGMKGERGRKGEPGVGEKGEPGRRGNRGPAGPEGPPGSKGDLGPMGPAGPAGNPGQNGIPGQPGATGQSGQRGDTGLPGVAGSPGPMGARGTDGRPGPTGPTGATGPRGTQGLIGPPGSQGPFGPPGADGKKGHPGPKGDRGVIGFPGPAGRPGAPGLQGPPGPPGAPGPVQVVIPNVTMLDILRNSYRGIMGGRSLGAPVDPALSSRTFEAPAASASDRLLQLLRREHNRVADALRRSNPLWGDERVFQTARRVVVAEWQHITYREYLPYVLGAGAGTAAGAGAGSGAGAGAGAGADPTVSVEFAGAAFRFWTPAGESPQRPVTATTRRSTRSFLDVIRATSPQRLSASSAADVNPSLERDAVNVLRGRDLGLPAYTTVRQLYTGHTVTDWADLEGLMDRPELEELRATYAAPRDIDLWVGGMLERRAPSAKVGPTFQFVISDQFRRLRDGDRLFYERSLNAAQLREVQKASLARLLCDNQQDVRVAAPLALEPLGRQNQMALCSSDAIPRPDLSVF